MSLRPAILALALLSTLRPVPAAADPATTGALKVPANRIVGLWITVGEVGPCGGGPTTIHVRNYLLFHTGGTVTENIVPTTVRSQGLGTWSYDEGTDWELHLRFDRFANGVYAGYTTVDRELLMSPDGLELTGQVRANFYDVDGNLTQELCGEATSTRIY